VAMISGLLSPDSGSVLFDGRAIRGASDPLKRKLGLVPQELALVEELTGLGNLKFFGALQDLGGKRLDTAMAEALEIVGLLDRAGDTVREYSGGMKRRLNLAAALLHDPQILLLDEPTVGVDPQSRNAIFEGLEALKARGKSLVYTTHYMEEAERLCDRIVIMDHGLVVADDALRNLSARCTARSRLRVDLAHDGLTLPWLDRVRALPGVKAVSAREQGLDVDLDDLLAAPRVLDTIAESGGMIMHFASEKADLGTVFLDLTGRTLRDS